MRYFLEFAYKGTQYHGWQRQPNAYTVQEALESCFKQVLRDSVTINGSSRTDTGVHAAHQVAHFDIENPLPPNFTYRINSCLPRDIAVTAIHLKDDTCHSRFDALERTYKYRIHTKKNPFLFETSLFYPKELDFTLMNKAASLLLNHTDFECFSKIKTDVFTFDCDIKEALWFQNNSHWEFKIRSNRFLRGMVRAIVGTLIEVGKGKRTIADFQKVLDSKNRALAGVNVKAHGLTLEKVSYPIGYFET